MKRIWILSGTAMLALALIAGVWGVTQWQANIEYKGRLEAIYQRTVSDAVTNLENMDVRMGKLLASNSQNMGVELLSDISREAWDAQSNLTSLPAQHDTTQEIIKFVNQIGDYCKALSSNVTNGQPINDAQLKQIEELQRLCSELTQRMKELSDVEWSAQQVAFLTTSEDANPMLNITQSGTKYPAMIYDGPFSDAAKLDEPKALLDSDVSLDEAMEIVRLTLGQERVLSVEPGSESLSPIEGWGMTAVTTDGNIYVNITKRGGHILWMVPEFAQFEEFFTMEQCSIIARTVLAGMGFDNMEPTYSQSYNGLAVINMAYSQDGVLVYPDLIKIQIRMDTGSVVGLECLNYLLNHEQRDIPQPAISPDAAKALASIYFEIDAARLCIIPMNDGERFCYELHGKLGQDTYLVYIDALNGDEVEILKVIDAPNGQLTM